MRRTLPQSLLLYSTVILTCALVLFPIYWMFVTAISPSTKLRTFPPQFFPEAPQWQIFQQILEARIPVGFFRMGFASAIGIVTLVICVLATRLMVSRMAKSMY